MPVNILELAPIIATISETIAFLRQKGLLAQNMAHCGTPCYENANPNTSDSIMFQCRICKKKISVREGSIFSRSRLPLKTLLVIIYCFSNGVSFTETRKLLVNAVNKNTIVQWFAYLREICSQWLLANRIILGSNGAVVQMDEALVGSKRKYNRGAFRGNHNWVFGMLDTNTENCILRIVPNRKSTTLMPIITQFCVPNCEIHTDEGSMYNPLSQNGFTHKTVCHTNEFVAQDGTHTNTIEGFWGRFKRHFQSMCGTKNSQFALHVDEFMYRQNRKRDGNMFDVFIRDIATFYPV